MTESAEKNFPAYSHLPYVFTHINIRQNKDKLISALPGNQIDFTGTGPQPAGDFIE